MKRLRTTKALRTCWGHAALAFSLLLVVCGRTAAQDTDAGLLERAQQAVVTILAYDAEGKVLREGVGFFIDREGHLVTDSRLLRGASRADARTRNDEVLPIKAVLAEDRQAGLVRLSVHLQGPRPAGLAVSDVAPLNGEHVWVFEAGGHTGTRVGIWEKTESYGIWDLEWTFRLRERISPKPGCAPIVNRRGKVVAVVTTRVFGNTPGQTLFAARRLRDLTAGNPHLFADWAVRFDKAWETTADGLCVRGLELLWAGKHADALASFEEARQKDADSFEAGLYAGYCKGRLGRPQEALLLVEKASHLKPTDPWGQHILGVTYYSLGRYPEGIEADERALELKGDFARAHHCLAKAYYQVGRYEDALTAFKKLSKTMPVSYEQHCQFGWPFILPAKHFSEAADVFEEAIKLRGDHWFGQYRMALSLHGVGSYRLALPYFERGNRYGWRTPQSYLWWSWCYQGLGRWEEMGRTIEECLKLNPGAYTHNFVGWAYLGQGRLTEAQTHFERGTEWQTYHEPRCGLGWVSYERGQFKEALGWFDEAIRREPSYVDALFGRGAACRRLGRLSEAIASFERALRFEPNHAGSRYELGLACLETGERERALRQCDMLVDLDTGLAADLLRRIGE